VVAFAAGSRAIVTNERIDKMNLPSLMAVPPLVPTSLWEEKLVKIKNMRLGPVPAAYIG
jgi:hypothetical protein